MELSPVENFLVDTSFAWISKTIKAPLNTVKLRMQLERHLFSRTITPVDCANKIVQKEGLAGLWRGNMYKCVRYIPPAMVNLVLKDTVNTLTRNLPGNWGTFLSGYLVGCVSLLVIYPFDFTVTTMIVDAITGEEFVYTDVPDVVRKVTKDGYLGLYRGFTASLIGIAVYRAAYFGLYFSTDRFLPAELSTTQSYLYRMILQLAAGVLAYPLDTIRRRQVIMVNENSFMETVRSIYEESGLVAFFDDYSLRLNILIGIVGILSTAGVSQLKNGYIEARCK